MIEPYRLRVIGPTADRADRETGHSERTHVKMPGRESAGRGDPLEVVEEVVGNTEEVDATEFLDTAAAYLEEQTSLLERSTIYLTQPSFTLGRHPDNDIVLGDRSISKFHARLECHNGAWAIEDLGSRNGVKINNTPSRRGDISDGDVLELGRIVFAFKHPRP